MIGCFLIWVLDFSIISMTNYCHSGSPTRGSYHSYISKNLRVSQTEKKKFSVSRAYVFILSLNYFKFQIRILNLFLNFALMIITTEGLEPSTLKDSTIF